MGQETSDLRPDNPQIVLFGDSLTALAFDAESRGFGWGLSQKYDEKAVIRNEGMLTSSLLS